MEQKDYDKDRDDVIRKCREKLKSIITCSAKLSDFNLALELHEKYNDFVFVSLGLHPTYIKEITEEDVRKAIDMIKKNKDKIVAVGEVGLDYYHIKEKDFQEKQKELFRRLIRLAKELDKPIIVHCRDAFEDVIKILEEEKAKKVLFHLFGDKNTISKVLNNGWSISIGPMVERSKAIKKIVKFMPLDKIMLETDSPWFGFGKRGTPLNVIPVADKIAEIKKIDTEEVDEQTDLNALNLFNLK